MNIIVCIKQVPDTTAISIDKKTNNLVREGIASIINPFDIYALEKALQLRDEHGGTVTAISMGPMQAISALQECLDLGADKAILLSDRAIGGSDTLATGYALSKLINSLDYDLILCGSEAIDGCTGQVGPIIAGNLDITQLSYVRSCSWDGKKLHIQREIGSKIEYYTAKLPTLVCMLKGEYIARKSAVSHKKPQIVSAEDLDIDINRVGNLGSPTKVIKINMLSGTNNSYVDVDDSLGWEERIRYIINGGMEQKHIKLWRGTVDELTERLMLDEHITKYIEV